MTFFGELKRRNVIRMAGLYLVGAWLVVQVAETILPAFEVPNWVMRAIVILLALDFIERSAGSKGNNADWAVMLPPMDPIRCEPRLVQIVSNLKSRDPRHTDVCKGKA